MTYMNACLLGFLRILHSRKVSGLLLYRQALITRQYFDGTVLANHLIHALMLPLFEICLVFA